MEFIQSETLGLVVAIAIVLKGFILLGAFFFKDRSRFLDAIAVFYVDVAPYIFFFYRKELEAKTFMLVYAALCFFLGGGGCVAYFFR